MSNKTYDVLKAIALTWLPALGTLYFTIAGIWGLPYAEQIVGTIVAIDTFLGVILGISTSSYKKGLLEGDSKQKLIKSINELLLIPAEENKEENKEEEVTTGSCIDNSCDEVKEEESTDTESLEEENPEDN